MYCGQKFVVDCEIGLDFTDVGYNLNNKAKSTVIFPRWIVSHLGVFTLNKFDDKKNSQDNTIVLTKEFD